KKEKAGKETNNKRRHNPPQNKKITNELMEMNIYEQNQMVRYEFPGEVAAISKILLMPAKCYNGNVGGNIITTG
ncbi:MAG TPA: hypothetical protein DEA55_11855, partial [Rhodospirillaceae bacterium]|nr:hypothetical protein [Rhodospirillaceae bacterium]